VVLGVAEQALEADPEPLNAESVLAAADRVFWQISGNGAQSESERCVVPGGAEGVFFQDIGIVSLKT
jgi:hypothetical protein